MLCNHGAGPSSCAKTALLPALQSNLQRSQHLSKRAGSGSLMHARNSVRTLREAHVINIRQSRHRSLPLRPPQHVQNRIDIFKRCLYQKAIDLLHGLSQPLLRGRASRLLGCRFFRGLMDNSGEGIFHHPRSSWKDPCTSASSMRT